MNQQLRPEQSLNYCLQKCINFNKLRHLLSGHIEQNPGPFSQGASSRLAFIQDCSSVLHERLASHGLIPCDVGGGGDCLFRAVADQLYGDSSHHFDTRAAAVNYLSDNPERFIESNTIQSWHDYLSSMSMQGTWADHLSIQAVADALSLRINNIESNEDFTEMSVVEAVDGTSNSRRNIYIGHVSEVHYVSTAQCGQVINQPGKNVFRFVMIQRKYMQLDYWPGILNDQSDLSN